MPVKNAQIIQLMNVPLFILRLVNYKKLRKLWNESKKEIFFVENREKELGHFNIII